MQETKEYLNTLEAAKYLGISDRTIRHYCDERKIQHYRPSKRVILFKQEWLDNFLHQATIKPLNKMEELNNVKEQ